MYSPGPITTTCHPPESAEDGYMEVETFSPGIRNSFEKIRCQSFTGVAEFQAEVRRVLDLRAKAEHWEPVVVRLTFADFEHQRIEIA